MNGNALMTILEMAKGFQKEIEEMKNTMRSNHQDEIRRIEQNFELEKRQINETHQSECDAYKIDIGQKNTKITNLNNTISGKNTRIDLLENSLNEKIHLIEDLQQTIKDNNKQIGTLQANLNKKIGENDDLRRINGDKDREYGKIKNTLDEKTRVNTNLQTRLDNKENENRDLKIKLQNKESENSNLRNSERQKGDENTRLERRLREANQKIDNLNSTINTKNNENRNLQTRIDKFLSLNDPNNLDLEIKFSNVPKYQEKFIIDTAKAAIQTKEHGSENGQGSYIYDQIKDKYGDGWFVVLIKYHGFFIQYSFCNRSRLYFRIGIYNFIIYKGGDIRGIFSNHAPDL